MTHRSGRQVYALVGQPEQLRECQETVVQRCERKFFRFSRTNCSSFRCLQGQRTNRLGFFSQKLIASRSLMEEINLVYDCSATFDRLRSEPQSKRSNWKHCPAFGCMYETHPNGHRTVEGGCQCEHDGQQWTVWTTGLEWFRHQFQWTKTDFNFSFSNRTPLNLGISQLTLLQNSAYNDSAHLKQQTMEIIEMMQVYLRKSGQTEQSDIIGSFKNRLDLHITKEDVSWTRFSMGFNQSLSPVSFPFFRWTKIWLSC